MTITDLAYDLTSAAQKLAAALQDRSIDSPGPAEVYEVFSELQLTIGQLDRVCKYLTGHSLQLADEPRLRYAAEPEPGDGPAAARTAAGQLQDAHRALVTLASALDGAQNAYCWLYLAEPAPAGEVAG